MAKKNLRRRNPLRGLAVLFAVLLIMNGLAMTAMAAAPDSGRTYGRGGNGNNSNATTGSVDHIDIGVSLTADIMIDGVLYENLTYTLQKSDLTAANLTISSSTGGHSYNLSNVSTSTGSSGIQQFRISGNFPVGTIEAPVYYTVSLNKTVSVDTPNGKVTVPVTFTASFQYWNSHNDCPGLRGNWSDGYVIGGSGLDFLLGNAETDVNTMGTISIQKTLNGLTIAEGETRTFTFDIYTADGTLYESISATVGSGSPYATTSISEVPFGTYYIIERAAAVDGYELATVYTVGGSNTTSKSADITLTTAAPNGAAYVTNTYTTLPPQTTSVSVTKVWENDTPSLRPEAIGVQLYQDGEPYGEAIGLSAENSWSYTWTDLPADHEWTVDEIRVPAGYVKFVTRDGNNFTITNAHEDPRVGEAYASVKKIWNDNGYPDRPTSVTVQLYCNGEAYGDPVTLNAANDWHYNWYQLNPDMTWTVAELNTPEGYTESIATDGMYFTITNSMDYTPPTEPDPTEPEPTEPEPTEPEPTEPEPTEPEPTEPEPTEPEPTEPEPTEPETTEPEPTEPEPTEPETTEPETTETSPDPAPQSDDGDIADVPQTGQALTIWAALSFLSGAGLLKIALPGKKKFDD